MAWLPFWLPPLTAAFVYAFAALAIKRVSDWYGPWRVAFFSNLAVAALFAPLFALPQADASWSHWWQPVLTGAGFFAGQVFTFLAIYRGDVSVATPLMASKTIFVALYAALLLGAELGCELWAAAALTTVAVALLRGGTAAERRRLLPSIVFGLLSAMTFGATDIAVQELSGPFGFNRFLPVMFGTAGLLSFGLIPLFTKRPGLAPPASRLWAHAGCWLLALQAGIVGWSLSHFGRAPEQNIVYAARGLFSLFFVWLVGRSMGLGERGLPPRELARRLAGALLLIGCVASVTLG